MNYRLRPRSITYVWITFVSLLWSGALAVRAADRYVSPPGGYGTNDTAGGYTNWAGAATNIQLAVTKAAAGDTIWVTNGTYYVYGTHGEWVTVDKGVTLKSVNGYSQTIISGSPGYGGAGGSTSGCVSVKHTNAVVDGFTCSNGWDYGGNGGPNRVWEGTLQNCLIVNCNAGGAGGGVLIWTNFNPPGLCVIQNCIIKRNRA